MQGMKTNNLEFSDLKCLLESKCQQYNNPSFIATDPVSIPHRFARKEDIEISAFLTATIAWGNRKSILANANRLMQMMDNAPYDFIINSSLQATASPIVDFVHRTFSTDDCLYFIEALRNIYQHHGGLEAAFSEGLTPADANVKNAISHFRDLFFELPHFHRTEKHVSNPAAGSASKRLNMFLRWMVRDDNHGVDFGLWKRIKPSQLCCPLDVHSGRTARNLGLLTRKANDWQAVEELTANLKKYDANDPVRYDFALFGIGVFENRR